MNESEALEILKQADVSLGDVDVRGGSVSDAIIEAAKKIKERPCPECHDSGWRVVDARIEPCCGLSHDEAHRKAMEFLRSSKRMAAKWDYDLGLIEAAAGWAAGFFEYYSGGENLTSVTDLPSDRKVANALKWFSESLDRYDADQINDMFQWVFHVEDIFGIPPHPEEFDTIGDWVEAMFLWLVKSDLDMDVWDIGGNTPPPYPQDFSSLNDWVSEFDGWLRSKGLRYPKASLAHEATLKHPEKGVKGFARGRTVSIILDYGEHAVIEIGKYIGFAKRSELK